MPSPNPSCQPRNPMNHPANSSNTRGRMLLTLGSIAVLAALAVGVSLLGDRMRETARHHEVERIGGGAEGRPVGGGRETASKGNRRGRVQERTRQLEPRGERSRREGKDRQAGWLNRRLAEGIGRDRSAERRRQEGNPRRPRSRRTTRSTSASASTSATRPGRSLSREPRQNNSPISVSPGSADKFI